MREFFQDQRASEYPEVERRKDRLDMHDIAHQLGREWKAELEAVHARISALTDSITSYMEKQADALHGFPGEDPYGHRAWHEAEIARINERAELYRKLRFELTKWGLFGFLGWACYQLWIAFLHGPGK